jgi:lipoate-protein ligase B
MTAFAYIIPCGITDRGVTSLAMLLGAQGQTPPAMDEVRQRVVEQFSAVFGVRVVGERESP